MTKVLIVKMTSMGDVLHVLPALEDLAQHVPELSVDWMVEESFSDIPAWHPLVDRVIPVATRRWRRWSRANLGDFRAFLKSLRMTPYDYIIDAQGLMKSAAFSRLARLARGGERIGFSGDSIKESPAAWLYSIKVCVSRDEHAVERLRQLVCGAFAAPTPETRRSYSIKTTFVTKDGAHKTGITTDPKSTEVLGEKSVFLFHGTTWATKHLPEILWYRIAEKVLNAGYTPVLTWGNDAEHQRALRIAEHTNGSIVLPKCSLTELADILSSASGAIAVDTGLGHLAAALDIPCVSLYGATDPALTGTYGQFQAHLQAEIACAPCLSKTCSQLGVGITEPPCYPTFGVESIWQSLVHQISARERTLGV